MVARRILALSLLAVTAAGGAAQPVPPRPHLVIDAGGHTASVSKVSFTSDGRHLVTAANDKTLRVWDVLTGEPLQVLRPPIGEGRAGALYALALSSDGRWLAAGGYEFSGRDHGIYLIRWPDRQIEAVLRGHSDVILDLAFSRDGRFLASASADRTARLWDLTALRSVATLRGHRDSVYAVAFSPDGRFLATASLDKTGRVWSVPAGTEHTWLRGHAAAVQAAAWSPDGAVLATGCVDQSIYVWSPEAPEAKLLRRYEAVGNHVTAIGFTGDSREIFFTLGGPAATDGGFLLDRSTHRLRTSFQQHENSVLHGTLSPDGSLAATVDANGELMVWHTRTGAMLHRLRSQGRTAWSAAWDPSSGAIAWGTASDYIEPNARGPLEFAFQFRDLDFVAPLAASLQRARTSLPGLAITPEDALTLSLSRAGGRTRLKLDSQYDEIRCFTALDENTVAVGSDGGLFLFDTNTGQAVRQLRGHSGAVWAVATSPDGRYLLSSSDDQTLRIWSWQSSRLLVSLFFADRDWIAWTPEGYYAASAAGERLIGWHINNGPDRMGSYFPAVQFRKSLYRPDVLRRLLDAGSLERALVEAEGARRPAIAPTGVEQVLPPMVQFISPSERSIEVSQPVLTVQASARSRSAHPVLALRLLLDGRPYEGSKGLQVVGVPAAGQAEQVQGQWTVQQLAPGRHTLAVQAETAASKGLSDEVEVFYREPRAAEQPRLPDLYVLAAGIADYDQAALRLAYAAKDAQDLAATLQQVSRPLFRQVHVRRLIDKQATRRELLAGFTWLRREMTQADVTVIFYSGHGAKDEAGNFYLVPVDGEPADLLATGVSGSQLKDALAAIPGRVLVLLDACHAGAAGGDRRKAVEVLTDDLVRDLVTDDYGVIVMCSSMGREYSRESDEHQQGYFTVALIEALHGKADYNQDGLVYLSEIETFLSDRVKSLTQGQQHPVTTKPATIRSFPLGKL